MMPNGSSIQEPGPGEPRTRILFVRHGETEWNRVKRFRGHADVPLNSTGVAQAGSVAKRLAGALIVAVYASPLSRTLRTAEAIAASHGVAVESDVALIDLNYGAWQGKTPEEVQRQDGERYERWQTAPAGVRIPGGETLPELQQRLMSRVRALTEQHAGGTIVLVSHDVVGRVLVASLLDADLNAVHRIVQDNATLDVFERRGDRWLIVKVNDTCHLAAAR